MGWIFGEAYRFELDSTDLTTPAEISIYDSEGVERTLADNEYVRLESMNIHMDNSVDEVEFFDDVDDDDTVDDGERLVHVGTNTQGNRPSNHDIQFEGEGKRLSVGRKPKAIADSSGNVTITGVCYIHLGKSPSATPEWKSQFGQ